MMKNRKTLLTALLGATMLTAGAASGQSILVMVSDGHTGENRTRGFGDWLETQISGSSVSFSADQSVNLLDTPAGGSFTTDQMNLANSFDVIIFPRHGTGSSSGYGSKDWNTVSSHVVTMNPFTGRSGNWAWHTGDSNMGTEFFTMTDSNDDVAVFTGEETVLTPLTPLADINGNVAATSNNDYGAVVLWDGSESSYFAGGTEGPGGPRTFFASNVHGPGPSYNADQDAYVDPSTSWTAEGQDLFVSTIPEPSTYALLAGLGVLGGALIRRRLRRRA